MAAGINGVLKGVQGDLKSTIMALSQEGWTPSKTNGGHIRLDHPDAVKPVFTASTPSDFRTPDNLRRDCRGALRSDQAFQKDAISEEEAMMSLKRHKAKQKSRKRMTGIVDTVGKRVVDGIIQDAVAPAQHRFERKTPPPQARRTKPRRTPATPAPSKENTEMKMTADIKPAEGPVAAVAPAVEQATPVQQKTETATRDEVATAPKKKVPAAAQTSHAVPQPGSDAFIKGVQVGIRIANGELMQIEITPDMVGKTLILERGEVFWLDGSGSVAPAPAKKKERRRNAAFSDAIVAFLDELKGEEVPVSMIADHMVENGFYKPRSARGGVSKRLEQLAEEGRVLYRKGPGEHVAKVVS